MTLRTLSDYLPAEKLRGFPTRTHARRASGRLWPHGEFSVGYTKDRPDGGDWHEDPFVGMGVDDVAMEARRAAGAKPLNLSDVPNSHKRPRRGLKGLTGYGKNMVKAFGFLLQEKYPRHRVTLGTVTLPPMNEAARREVVEGWSELVREYLQWLSRRLGRQGLPQVVCSVTEVQPKRLADGQGGYLHLHTLWLNQPGKAGNWAIDPCDLRAWLEKYLERKIPSYSGGHVNVNVKPVEGEVARYMAKYMSKGGECLAEAVEDWGEDNCPRTWWNMTAPARTWVKSEVHQGPQTGAILEALLGYLWDTGDDSWLEFLRHVEIEFDGVAITVGYRGRITRAESKRLRGMLKSGQISGQMQVA